jgi:hypothetical protein
MVTSTNMSLAVLPSILKKPRLEWRMASDTARFARLGGIAAVNIDAHAHLGDTAHACHPGFLPSFGRHSYRIRHRHAISAEKPRHAVQFTRLPQTPMLPWLVLHRK